MLLLDKNKTWTLVNKSKGQNIVDCEWIYKIKESESKDKNVRKGIDYNEIFSHVVKYTFIRALLFFVSQFNFELEH